MTNEEVYRTFLKKHRKYSYFKRNFKKGLAPSHIFTINRNDVLVKDAINYSFVWRHTAEGSTYWQEKALQWQNLCSHFKLKGCIDLNRV